MGTTCQHALLDHSATRCTLCAASRALLLALQWVNGVHGRHRVGMARALVVMLCAATRLEATLTARINRDVMSSVLPRMSLRPATFAVPVLAPLCGASTALLPSAPTAQHALVDRSAMLRRQEHTVCAVPTARRTQHLSGEHGRPAVGMGHARAQ